MTFAPTIFLVLMPFWMSGSSIRSLQEIQYLKDLADEYVISQVGEKYFEQHFEYIGCEPYPSDLPPGELRIVHYQYTISVGDYRENIVVTVWLNIKGGNWQIGNGYDSMAENLPNCVHDERKCMPFQTTKDEALAVAYNAGAFDGAVRYKVDIHYYYGDLQAHIWCVTTYKSAISGMSAIVSLVRPELLILSDWGAFDASPEFDSVYHRDLENAVGFRPRGRR